VKVVNRAHKEHNFMVVDLTDNVMVDTPISSAYHPALRSGFAGYPVNPRWNATKVQAWRTGRQWRDALSRGDMVVRSTDSMLIPASQQEDTQEENASTPSPAEKAPLPFLAKAKQMLTGYQLA
jgi:hypothetical protein